MKDASEEISVLRKEAKKHRAERVQFEQMRKIWEDQGTSVSKTLENTKKTNKVESTTKKIGQAYKKGKPALGI